MKIMMKYFPEVGLSPGYGITEATCIVSGIHPDISRNNKELFYEKSILRESPIEIAMSKLIIGKVCRILLEKF